MTTQHCSLVTPVAPHSTTSQPDDDLKSLLAYLAGLPSEPFPHPSLPASLDYSSLEHWLYRHFDSRSRLSALIDVRAYDYIDNEFTLYVLGAVWQDCDTVWHERESLDALFRSAGPYPLMR